MDSLFKKGREKKGLLLTLAGLLPLFLCLFFTFIEAKQIGRRQQAVTASMLLTQAETISDQAWSMVNQLRQFSDSRCGDIVDILHQHASFFPYFRSVGIMHDGDITCSSIFGGKQSDLATVIQRPLPENNSAAWMLSVAGTFGVEKRPAVLFIRHVSPHFGAYALVDGQYLVDFMNAVGKSHGYSIGLRFGDGYEITNGASPGQDLASWKNPTLSDVSERYPITVRITSPYNEAIKNWRQALLTFLPMAVILSLLLMTVTNNWLKRKLSVADQFKRALQRREFSINYQPVYNIKTGKVGGAEALMRWQLPNGHWVRPDIFITAAEAADMIVPLTQHLLMLLAEETKSWPVSPGFHLGVNIAAAHLQHPDFVEDIRKFAAEVAKQQFMITLELTERSLISDGNEVIEKLKLLRSEGLYIAIDDFGTGHCSLSYLQTFPLDYLKVDRGFVNAIESTEGEAPVLDAIINLSHKLKLRIVAEGVETPVQLDYLKARGVVYIQGYLYAKPMTNSALLAWFPAEGQRPLTPIPEI